MPLVLINEEKWEWQMKRMNLDVLVVELFKYVGIKVIVWESNASIFGHGKVLLLWRFLVNFSWVGLLWTAVAVRLTLRQQQFSLFLLLVCLDLSRVEPDVWEFFGDDLKSPCRRIVTKLVSPPGHTRSHQVRLSRWLVLVSEDRLVMDSFVHESIQLTLVLSWYQSVDSSQERILASWLVE